MKKCFGKDDKNFVISHKTKYTLKAHTATTLEVYDFTDITSIQFKEPAGVSVGFIQFTHPGTVGSVTNAVNDENSILVNPQNLELAKEIYKFIEEKRSTRNTTGNNGSLDDLRKLKELLDSEIISQEEFDANKKQILGL